MIKALTVGFAVYVAGAPAPIEEVAPKEANEENRRELFPLTAVAKRTHAAQHAAARNPATRMALGDATKGPVKALEMLALNDDMNTVVQSDSMCTRRSAMARAAGLAAGLSLAAVN